MSNFRQITRDGLWDKNVVFGQMLALCPTLAVTSTATNGLGMGLATTAVLIASGAVVSSVRRIITDEIRIAVFVLLIAGIVSLVDMAMNAWLHGLHKVLGLFIPLIVTNCAILGRAEAFASKNTVLASAADGLMMGVGFTFALTLLGAVREILGSGTLFAHAESLLGNSFAFLDITVIPHYKGFLLMILPPGGFIVLGFLLAGKRILDVRMQRAKAEAGTPSLEAANAV